MAQWSTLMPCNREATGSNLSGVLALILKSAHYEVDYSGNKTFLAGLQCTLTSSCAIIGYTGYEKGLLQSPFLKQLTLPDKKK